MNLLNPALMYAAIWSLVLFLYAFRLSDLLEPLRVPTIVLVAGTSISFVLGWVLESLGSEGRFAVSKFNIGLLTRCISSPAVSHRLRFAWAIFCLGVGLEVVLFGGAPGLGLLGIGAAMAYTDFGIHGFHGLMNAIFFGACAIAFTRVLLGVSRRAILLTLTSLAYPLLTLSREVLISVLLTYFFIYLSVRRPSPTLFIRAGVLFTITFFVFGYLGDLRSGRDNIVALGAPSFEYPDWLPSAFIWFYIYLCTPLNNVNHNIDIAPNYLPLETAGTFIPSFARDSFMASLGGQKEWNLVSDTFNVSSLLQSLLTDFGVGGSIAVTLLCGVVFSRVLRRSEFSAASFFVLIVLMHGIALSFFANLLFNLISVFEMLIVTWIVGRGRYQ